MREQATALLGVVAERTTQRGCSSIAAKACRSSSRNWSASTTTPTTAVVPETLREILLARYETLDENGAVRHARARRRRRAGRPRPARRGGRPARRRARARPAGRCRCRGRRRAEPRLRVPARARARRRRRGAACRARALDCTSATPRRSPAARSCRRPDPGASAVPCSSRTSGWRVTTSSAPSRPRSTRWRSASRASPTRAPPRWANGRSSCGTACRTPPPRPGWTTSTCSPRPPHSWRNAGEPQRSLAMIEIALAEVDRANGIALSRLLRDKATVLSVEGRVESVAVFEAALDALAPDEEPMLRANILAELAAQYMISDRPEEAIVRATSALEIAPADARRSASIAANIRGGTLIALGRIEEGLADFALSRQFAEGDTPAQLRFFVNYSDTLHLLGPLRGIARRRERRARARPRGRRRAELGRDPRGQHRRSRCSPSAAGTRPTSSSTLARPRTPRWSSASTCGGPSCARCSGAAIPEAALADLPRMGGAGCRNSPPSSTRPAPASRTTSLYVALARGDQADRHRVRAGAGRLTPGRKPRLAAAAHRCGSARARPAARGERRRRCASGVRATKRRTCASCSPATRSGRPTRFWTAFLDAQLGGERGTGTDVAAWERAVGAVRLGQRHRALAPADPPRSGTRAARAAGDRSGRRGDVPAAPGGGGGDRGRALRDVGRRADGPGRPRSGPRATAMPKLTAREQQVLDLVAEGLSATVRSPTGSTSAARP